MTYDQIDEQCRRRGYSRKDTKEVLKTRLAPMDAEQQKCSVSGDSTMDTSVTVTGKRSRVSDAVAENSGKFVGDQDEWRRVGGLHLAFVADREVAKERAKWWNLGSQARRDATQACAEEEVNDAISAWVAEECNRVSGQELTEVGEKLR